MEIQKKKKKRIYWTILMWRIKISGENQKKTVSVQREEAAET